MTSCWAAEENCCIYCKQCDIQQGFGPRTFILCACCQDRGSHVECEEKASGTGCLAALDDTVMGLPAHDVIAIQHAHFRCIHIRDLMDFRWIAVAAGLPVSPQALEAGNDWFCSQVTAPHQPPQQTFLSQRVDKVPCAGLQQGQSGSGSAHQSGQDAISRRHSLQ